MGKLVFGVILIFIGVIALAWVHSMRPPSDFADALMMVGQGRDSYIKEPLYQIFMAVSALVTLLGAFLAFTGWKARNAR